MLCIRKAWVDAAVNGDADIDAAAAVVDAVSVMARVDVNVDHNAAVDAPADAGTNEENQRGERTTSKLAGATNPLVRSSSFWTVSGPVWMAMVRVRSRQVEYAEPKQRSRARSLQKSTKLFSSQCR